MEDELSKPLIKTSSKAVNAATIQDNEHKCGNKLVNWLTFIFWILSFLIGGLIKLHETIHMKWSATLLTFIVLFSVGLLIIVVVITLQPRDLYTISELYFHVPLVPLLPALAIFVHVCLMMQLSVKTWFRFIIWNAVGVVIYFLYGLKNASKKFQNNQSNNTSVTEVDSQTDDDQL